MNKRYEWRHKDYFDVVKPHWNVNLGSFPVVYGSHGYKSFDGEYLFFFEKIWFVYRIYNIQTGRCYIGKSTNPNQRIKSHYQILKAGKHYKEFQEDFDNYGEDSFRFEVLGIEHGTRCGQGDYEREMQKKYKSYLPECGYDTRDNKFYQHGKKCKTQEEVS